MALAKWRQQASVIALGGLGAALGFAVLFAVIGRQFRRQAEQNAILTATAAALRASEARMRDFAEMSSDWFWEQDAELRFTWISDVATSGYGRGRESPRKDPMGAGQRRPEHASFGVITSATSMQAVRFGTCAIGGADATAAASRQRQRKSSV